MAQTKVMTELENILKENKQKYYIDGILNKARVIEDLNNYDTELIKLLGKSEIVKKHFLIEVNGNKILKINELIEIFEMNEYWNDSYTSYENKIGISSNGKFLSDNTDVVLDFPYKDTVLKATMSKEEVEKGELLPEEPFLNEKIARDEIDTLFDKKILVNSKKYNKVGNENTEVFSEKDNLIIKGNNLITLHSLKEKFNEKIKLILIDPPYNTGRDSFLYNDKFNRSTWLTFMKNRLKIASELLSDDGAIFISIDEKQEAYLKVLCDEIFGENNLLEVFHIQARYTSKSLNEKDDFQPVMEYMLGYAKDKKKFTPNKPYKEYDLSKFKWEIIEKEDGQKITLGGKSVEIFKEGQYEIKKLKNPNIDGLKDTWASGSVLTGNTSGKFFDQYLSKRKEIDGLKTLYKVEGIGEDGLGYRYFTGPKKESAIRGQFYSGVPLERRKEIETGEAKKYYPIVNYYDFSGSFGNIRHEGGVPFNNGKKPENMLRKVIEMATNERDIVLDFFLGSGSTVATAHKLNRQYIGIEQMEYIEDLVITRLQNVINGDHTGISQDVNWQGGGNFVYAELMEKNTGYLKDVIEAKSTDRLRQLFNLMLEYADFDFRVDLEEVKDSVWRLPLEDQKRTLIKIIDKNQLYYNYSEIDDENVRDLISNSDYAFNKSLYENEGDENE